MYSLWDRIKSGIAEIFRTRVFVVIIAFCLLFSILVLRLFDLQIIHGQQYLDEYRLQIRKTRILQGTRGNIYDRNGVLLAYNELAYSVTIEDTGYYESLKHKNKELNKEISQIIEIVESNGDSVINDFDIILDSNNQYQYAMDNETLKLRFIANVFGKATIDGLSDEQRNMTAAGIIDHLCTDEQSGYGINQDKLDRTQVLKLVTIRYAISLNNFQKYIPTIVAEDVSDETVAGIMERIDTLQGVDVAENSLRRYKDSKYFANIIGYTGQISHDEYNAFDKEEKKKYSLTDTIGKSGLEQIMDSDLQGAKGEIQLYVNSVGRVIESTEIKEPQAGNNLVLTIDANLQKAAYDILEQELAGILLAKMQDILDYDRSKSTDAGTVVVASGDAYNSFISNDIVDMKHFSDENAKAAEKRIYATFSAYKEDILRQLVPVMQDAGGTIQKDMSREWQNYLLYVVNDILTTNTGILMKDAIDTEDETYLSWRDDESINIHEYLTYAISKNWIDVSKLQNHLKSEDTYSNADEIYNALVAFVADHLASDSTFDKLVYRYMIKAGTITGRDLCMTLYEQEILEYDEAQYNALASGAVGAYDFLRGKIQTLDITPGQLGLEPCTGSLVMTDPDSGDVLASVSYPGYDNNRLANTMDSKYYNQLLTNQSRPFYNNATQEKTAPGSTYKPISAIAGLTEGVVDLGSAVYCDGVYKNATPNIHCWIYPGEHGSMDVINGLSNSCNCYFCEVGFRLSLTDNGASLAENGDDGQAQLQKSYSSELGLSKLREYATMFGLNEKSGIELPESDPQISDDSSIPSAMGQGTNNFTTSQLAKYIATVANRGTVRNLTLLDRIEKVDGTVVKEFTPKISNNVESVSSDTWDAVHAGMRGVVSTSQVFDAMNASDISLSGKTGTAQQSTTHPDHGLFVGFAPSDSPEVAFAIRIANGYSSTFAAEVGSSVMQYYYDITDPEKLITGSAASVTVTTSGD